MAKLGPVPIWPWNSTVHYRLWTSIQDLFHPNSWQTPVAAVTVYSAPDDGRKGRPKHVLAQFGPGIVQCSTDIKHLYRIYSNPTHDKNQWLLLQFIVFLMMEAKGVHNLYSILVVVNKHNTARPWHLYRIYSNPTHDKHQWLLLKFIVFLMMEAKGVRNM